VQHVEDIVSTIHPHPTYSEAVQEAAEAAIGNPIHFFMVKRCDMDYKDFIDSYIETKYGKIHYKHNNSNGIELVLLHGLGANSIVWRKLVEI